MVALLFDRSASGSSQEGFKHITNLRVIRYNSGKWTAVAAEEEHSVVWFDGDGAAYCVDKFCRFARAASQGRIASFPRRTLRQAIAGAAQNCRNDATGISVLEFC
jgi:hypothetical protein